METFVFFKILHISVHKSINNFIFKHSTAQTVTVIVEENNIQRNQKDLRVYIVSFDENYPFVYSGVEVEQSPHMREIEVRSLVGTDLSR